MRLKRIFLYGLYTAAAFALLVLFCFPADKIVLSLSEEADRMGLTFAPQRVHPSFPLGLICDEPEIGLGKTLSIFPDHLRFHLPLSALFASPTPFEISGTWHGGQIKGRIGNPFVSTSETPVFQLSLSGVGFDEILYNTDNFSLKGAFSLDGSCQTKTRDGRPVLNGSLALSRVRCMMQDGALKEAGIDRVEFSTITVEFFREDSNILAITCKAEGNLADMDLKGQITGNGMTAFEDLGLDLKGYLRPAPEHAPILAGFFPLASLFDTGAARGIPVHITGTAGAPRIGQ